MIRQEDSLIYHKTPRPGKIEVKAAKTCLTPRDMRLAYLPGASYPSLEIMKKKSEVFQYTAKGNLVGVITNGTAIPGLGNIGPLAAKPMQEGMAMLFKRLADIDVFDIELNTTDPDRFIETVVMLEPTFGGINLKDIKAPEGLYIYDRLRETLKIPVFHENLYSTAVVAVAALLNALDLVEKQLNEIRVVICGGGTVGIGCARLLLRLGIDLKKLLIYDVNGLLHPERNDLYDYQIPFARESKAYHLADGIKEADVFIGASAGGVLNLEMIHSMNHYPIVLALATPDPEIGYEEAKCSRQDIIMCTGLDQYPNAVMDILSFPYIFRGALDVQAGAITENMMLAAARALADLAREDVVEEVERVYGNEYFSFGPEYLLPKAIDPRILIRESAAVARQAVEDGVANIKMDSKTYEDNLAVRLGKGRETLRSLIMRARQKKLRVVFSEGSNETILRATGIIIDEGIANPILIGNEEEIRNEIDLLGLDLGGVNIIDPTRNPHFNEYVDEYFSMRRRRGVMHATAVQHLCQQDYFAAMMVLKGHADMMIAGYSTHYVQSLRTIVQVIGTAPGIRHISSYYLILLPKDVVSLADCTVNINPDADDLAEIAILAAMKSRSLGFDPHVAMLSFSNFGSVDHPNTIKVRKAVEIVKERYPDLEIDGEMQLAAARDSIIRESYFPFSTLKSDANVLIFPDLQSGSLALHSLQYMAEAIPVGPMLMGTRMPAHIVQYGATVEEVINLTTVGAVDAAANMEGKNIKI
jgi:malate dehydrogenase (oxaloacetate-decarboxylating)(NADP+)